MQYARRTRKRKILLETKGNYESKYKSQASIQGNFFPNQRFVDLHRKNRFIVHLEKECDNEEYKCINEDRIQSFKFSLDNEGNKMIIIESTLQINEWIEDFLDVNMCKLYLLGPTGQVVSFFDYDIVNSGYEYELSYSDEDLLTPKFFYRIF